MIININNGEKCKPNFPFALINTHWRSVTFYIPHTRESFYGRRIRLNRISCGYNVSYEAMKISSDHKVGYVISLRQLFPKKNHGTVHINKKRKPLKTIQGRVRILGWPRRNLSNSTKVEITLRNDWIDYPIQPFLKFYTNILAWIRSAQDGCRQCSRFHKTSCV